MKIVCPNCSTSYDVGSAAIGETGRSVRCVRCHGVWFVSPGDAEPEPDFAPAAMVPDAIAEPEPEPVAAAAAELALDDMAAWGLSDTPEEPPAPAANPTDDPFSMDSMFSDMQAQIPATDGPPLVPGDDDWQALGAEFATSPDGDGPARRPRPGPALAKKVLRPPTMPSVIVVLVAILAGLVGWRGDVVRVMPQTASLFAAIGLPVNLRGLAFQEVTTTKELQDGVPVLVVEGKIINISRLMLEVPRIRFAMRNAAGNEVYNWTSLPTRPVLAPNAEQSFRTRLASPPADGRDITVRFFNRQDAVGGLR